MTTPAGYRRIDVPKERGHEMLDVDAWAFALTIREEEFAPLIENYRWDRARAIEVADPSRGPVGKIAATHTSFGWQMRVPGGGSIPTAGLSWVGVHQGHRRRGLLSSMIDDHFTRSISRGEFVSTLFAAETEIYQRFGYGLAARELRMTLGRGTKLRPMPEADALDVELDTASLEKHGGILTDFQTRLTRPGTVVNLDPAIKPLFHDPIDDRDGGEPQRIALVRDGDHVVAYALFRRKSDWSSGAPEGKTGIGTYATTTAASSHRLWSVLADLDLMTKTETWLMPTDDPLLHQLVDERSVKPALRDNLWLRVLDVKAALEARGYASDANVTIALEDKRVPANAGTWKVAIRGGEARVERADDAKPDLAMNIQELGAVYLGGVALTALLGAGIVTEHTAGSASALSRAMLSDVAPISTFPF